MLVQISKKELRKFRNFVKISYPNECCGFLIGYKNNNIYINNIYIPLDQNKWADPGKIDIQDDWWDDAFDLAKELNLKVLGVIHSHPDYCDISMSEADTKMLEYIKVLYPEIKDPIMGIVGIWKAKKRMMTKVGIWPIFGQYKVCQK
jgi:proteasome lid subunit RPN8/RPN11